MLRSKSNDHVLHMTHSFSQTIKKKKSTEQIPSKSRYDTHAITFAHPSPYQLHPKPSRLAIAKNTSEKSKLGAE